MITLPASLPPPPPAHPGLPLQGRKVASLLASLPPALPQCNPRTFIFPDECFSVSTLVFLIMGHKFIRELLEEISPRVSSSLDRGHGKSGKLAS